jgi:peptidoglycan/xylan/chitin deacetylase (PgdA/CDA1 family)
MRPIRYRGLLRRLAGAAVVGFLAPPAAIAAACAPGGLGDGRAVEISAASSPAIGGIDSRAAKAAPDNTFQPLALRDGEIVLTFDDGPGPETISEVLAALEQHCVKATFFLLGRNAKRHPELVRRLVAAGHGIGSHTWSHARLSDLPAAAARREIEQGQAAIAGALAGMAEAPSATAFFRFPNLAYSEPLVTWLQDRGTVSVSADITTKDWSNPPAEQTLRAVLRQLERRRKGIVLLHDLQPNTAALLPRLLDALAAGGYRVVTLQAAHPGADTD